MNIASFELSMSTKDKPICPVDGCDRPYMHPWHVMCSDCWKLVDKSTKNSVWKAIETRNDIAIQEAADKAIAAANLAKKQQLFP